MHSSDNENETVLRPVEESSSPVDEEQPERRDVHVIAGVVTATASAELKEGN